MTEHPLEVITRGSPSLEHWWSAYQAESVFEANLSRLHLSEFATHVLQLAKDGATADVQMAAGGIERALEMRDADLTDQVVISVLETFIMMAKYYGVPLGDVYSYLGPIGRKEWEETYKWFNDGISWPGAAA